MGGKLLGQVPVQLKQLNHKIMADGAAGEGRRGRGSGVKPGLETGRKSSKDAGEEYKGLDKETYWLSTNDADEVLGGLFAGVAEEDRGSLVVGRGVGVGITLVGWHGAGRKGFGEEFSDMNRHARQI